MFDEIIEHENWQKIEKINRGWSDDTKYYIESTNKGKLLLRTSSIDQCEIKKKEYEVIYKFAHLGFKMSVPVGFGICNDHQNVYMLITWIEGEDLELALPKLTSEKQYLLGREAGTILRNIHGIKVPENEIPKKSNLDKKIMQINRYKESNVRIPGDEVALRFIDNNLHKIWSKPPVYQHGDFHPGNLILTPEGKIGVIDFNRWDIGDPYEEFYKLELFGTEASIPFCAGQIDAYFNDNVPEDFWEILAVYVAHASLFSIKWAEKFGQHEIDNMTKICQKSFVHYDHFSMQIPNWYQKFKCVTNQ